MKIRGNWILIATLLLAAADPFGPPAISAPVPPTPVIHNFDPNNIVSQFEKPLPDYTKDVLVPLAKAQAKEAAQQAAAEAAAEAAAQAAAAAQQAYLNSIANRVQPTGTYSNNYAWGNCTAYVASRINVPDSLGNADNWAYELGQDGWTVSNEPVVGAIAQTTNGWAGHVAIVEGIGDGYVTVSEENVEGLGVIDTQTYPTSYFNYIY